MGKNRSHTRDPMLITRTLDIALPIIFAHQRRLARRAGALAPRTGAITFVQRFGGALNLSVHFRCIIPRGTLPEQRLSMRARARYVPCSSALPFSGRKNPLGRLPHVPIYHAAARKAAANFLSRAGGVRTADPICIP